MKPGVLLVHGFNVRDGGRGSTDRLRPYLQEAGFRVYEADYGWMGLLGVRMNRTRMARKIAVLSDRYKCTIAIGHSNGCHFLREATFGQASIPWLVLINPALDSDADFSPHIKGVQVHYAEDDIVVPWARLIPGSPWGDMGRRGYRGDDPRVESFCSNDIFPPGTSIGHSGVFAPQNVTRFATRMIKLLRGRAPPGRAGPPGRPHPSIPKPVPILLHVRILTHHKLEKARVAWSEVGFRDRIGGICPDHRPAAVQPLHKHPQEPHRRISVVPDLSRGIGPSALGVNLQVLNFAPVHLLRAVEGRNQPFSIRSGGS